eukprot:CAMPEP_0176374594 /NCGR_PEP_ID=MMETSP0126-20121128/26875_1 /TAXON_ID=141414 ORGANISM="Strombidinopsis acuminatum, Strain SPMC142" /NCGR_SAMPLE_ID=MMETSP0126 /ASSEMBLY_ACC=CAM_ASM_000229 /LENGTH=33 /DNA_ID= /DNA_START= /DNA_END= /DNA_ORIENTATION=
MGINQFSDLTTEEFMDQYSSNMLNDEDDNDDQV